MLRMVCVVVALIIVSSTSSAHELRPLIVAPRHATAIVGPLVVVELPLGASRFDVLSLGASRFDVLSLGASRFDVLSLRTRLQIRGTVIERRSNRIVVLRTFRAVRLLPQVVRSRSFGRTILLRRR